jgi:hypothetical protein
MKITVIVPTGEVRVPDMGEYYRSMNDTFWICCIEKLVTTVRPIGKAHEIEVPESANQVEVVFTKGSGSLDFCGTASIPLPSPKKKVKKWQWVIGNFTSNNGFLTDHYTDNGIRYTHPGREYYHKIPETEIEVEE